MFEVHKKEPTPHPEVAEKLFQNECSSFHFFFPAILFKHEILIHAVVKVFP